MAGWTTTHPSRVRPVADEKSITRHGTGVQIKWADVDAAYLDSVSGKKVIPAFTAIGTLLGAGKASPRVANTNPAVGYLETVAIQDDPAAPGGGMYGMVVTGNLYENLLPDATGSPLSLDQDIKDELVAAGGRFYYQTYTDTP